MKEEHEELTVTDIFEQIKQEICDDFCKYPGLMQDQDDLYKENGPCSKCPLNKL